MFYSAPAIAAAAASLALGACGDDGPAAQGAAVEEPTPTSATGDPERYCTLTRELDTAGEKSFAGPGAQLRCHAAGLRGG